LQIAISDLHKQTIAEHRQSTELTDTTFSSNNSSTEIDEFRRQQHLIRWRKEQWQIDFVQVLCHPAIREIDISREVRHCFYFVLLLLLTSPEVKLFGFFLI
jgi:hypothetical protein